LKTVALDAMGGDHAPGPEVEGALAAVREKIARVVLVGDENRLKEELAKRGAKPSEALSLQHASQVITMDDHPSVAAKGKKDSSMRVAFDLAKNGKVDAVVSAGNSGAMMACGLFVMRRLPGVDRPGIVTTFPTRNGVCALIDMGANVDCRPHTLAQFAVLGSVYAKVLHGKASPKVGVLSNGEEPSKGTELTRAADRLLAQSVPKDFTYLGYVEGKDIFTGDVDVVVTDGFTGNVLLKTAEGVGQTIFAMLKDEIVKSATHKAGAFLLRNAFRRLKKKLEYDEHGGAPLVGVDGVAVLCHGRSNAKAIKNGVRVGASFAEAHLPHAVSDAIEKHAPLWASEEAHAQGS
jgi:glycerol-3-phosphate acyltransferase PlsX